MARFTGKGAGLSFHGKALYDPADRTLRWHKASQIASIFLQPERIEWIHFESFLVNPRYLAEYSIPYDTE